MRSIRGGRRGIDTGRKVVQGTTLLHAPRMGTDAWKNWRAFDSGEPERENYDDELQSDVSFIGGPADFGPFKLSIVIRGVNVGHEVGPALIVHGGVHANLIPEIVINGKLAKADSTAYHGGSMSDEIAALVSLIAGVRLRAAGTVRLSGIHDPDDEDPGTPILFEVPRLSRPGRGDRELIPSAVRRPTNLDGLDRLAYLPSLAENFQVELVRAARAYASGLWWANEDPNRAWLQLVTAVEVAAKARQVGNPTSREYTPLARCRDQRCQTHELRTEPLSTGPRPIPST